MKTKHFYLFLVAFITTSFSLQAGTTPPLPPTAGIFLYFPNVTTGKGSVANGHPDEVDILALSYGFSRTGTGITFQEYAFTKYQDGSTNALQTLLTGGTSTDGPEIKVYKSVNGVVTLVSRTQMKGVIVTSYSSGGSSGELTSGCSTCSGFVENVTVTFTGIKIDNFTNNFN